MIKAAILPNDIRKGRLILGLSRENVKRLIQGQPIVFDASSYGYDGTVVIMFGETEAAIVEELRAAGVILPDMTPPPPGTTAQ